MVQEAKLPNAERQDFYRRISPLDLAPLWEVLSALVPPTPRVRCVPALWRYADVRPYLLESADIISAREAQRRVLVLENPASRGESRITNTLYAGLQLILPGEVAPSHRHTQSAMRFVIEGENAYTAVDGEKALMKPGDLILTPAWTWHDHGNESQEPMVWLDALDIPLVTLLDAGFAEESDVESRALSRPAGDSYARYGSNLLPVEYRAEHAASPVFSYPYERTREVLEKLKQTGPFDPAHGLRMKYINPATGDYALPTIASFMQLLPEGFRGASYRSTDSAVFVAVEGKGRTRVGDEMLNWGPNDVFVVPGWTPYAHEAIEGDAVLFSYSDRATQEKLGLWREKREHA